MGGASWARMIVAARSQTSAVAGPEIMTDPCGNGVVPGGGLKQLVERSLWKRRVGRPRAGCPQDSPQMWKKELCPRVDYLPVLGTRHAALGGRPVGGKTRARRL